MNSYVIIHRVYLHTCIEKAKSNYFNMYVYVLKYYIRANSLKKKLC